MSKNGKGDPSDPIETARREAVFDGRPLPPMDYRLPDRDDEARLRRGEMQVAQQVHRLAQATCRALRSHDRVPAAVLLQQLSQVCAHASKAEQGAINGAMQEYARNLDAGRQDGE